MKLKSKPGDFRVRELLVEEYLKRKGAYSVYRVTKRKHTSLEAARALAQLAGVPPSEVGMAGLKDRQGVTTQHMSVHRGRRLTMSRGGISIEAVGHADEPISGKFSTGNAFEIVVRDVRKEEADEVQTRLAEVAELGLPNYFGEQRFGNMTHGQGWIARELMFGRHEEALKRLLCAPSDQDYTQLRKFKQDLTHNWRNWRACREAAVRFGQHHSIFEHLIDRKSDFAGAFRFVSTRIRLIHLYAYQSHLWNRAVCELFIRRTKRSERLFLKGIEGPLVFPRKKIEGTPDQLRLPGPGLEDVTDPELAELYEGILERDRLRPQDYNIKGVPGFAIKGEDRTLMLRPEDLDVQVKSGESERLKVRLRFSLPRGAYATMVVSRLLEQERPPGRERPKHRSKRTES